MILVQATVGTEYDFATYLPAATYLLQLWF